MPKKKKKKKKSIINKQIISTAADLFYTLERQINSFFLSLFFFFDCSTMDDLAPSKLKRCQSDWVRFAKEGKVSTSITHQRFVCRSILTVVL
jgi:hypothetical protein